MQKTFLRAFWALNLFLSVAFAAVMGSVQEPTYRGGVIGAAADGFAILRCENGESSVYNAEDMVVVTHLARCGETVILTNTTTGKSVTAKVVSDQPRYREANGMGMHMSVAVAEALSFSGSPDEALTIRLIRPKTWQGLHALMPVYGKVTAPLPPLPQPAKADVAAISLLMAGECGIFNDACRFSVADIAGNRVAVNFNGKSPTLSAVVEAKVPGESFYEFSFMNSKEDLATAKAKAARFQQKALAWLQDQQGAEAIAVSYLTAESVFYYNGDVVAKPTWLQGQYVAVNMATSLEETLHHRFVVKDGLRTSPRPQPRPAHIVMAGL